jgi:DnaA family protein
MRQLPLGLRLRDAARFESYVPGPNAQAVAALERAVSPGARRVLWLWGRAGTGKTHLLQSACARVGERGGTAAWFDARAADLPLLPGFLDGAEQLDLVALDGLEPLLGSSDWNGTLFRLHTLLLEAGGSLVIATAAAPASLAFTLPDLRSRLLAAEVFQLHELGEAEQVRALQLRAARRGLELGEDAALYLLRRCPRDMHSLCELLDLLDDASLVERRRLTVPFLRTALEQAGLGA